MEIGTHGNDCTIENDFQFLPRMGKIINIIIFSDHIWNKLKH